MKIKTINKTAAIYLAACLSILALPFSVLAATPSASVSGPATVRAGDTITISVKMSGTGVVSTQGEIQYDAGQLSYKSSGGNLTAWSMDVDGSTSGKVTFLGIDDKLAAPINSSSQLFTLVFQVKDNVAAGSKITVTATRLAASDGTNDFSPANASYSVNASAPLSGNVLLSTLTVANATLSPAFNKNTVDYTVSVPFGVEKLDITATAEDSKSKVSIGGNALAAGTITTVTVTVSAESGAKKAYVIKATREKDPNYKAGGDASLSSITVEGFLISPVFNPQTTTYLVWLPYEVDRITVAGKATDAKATVAVTGGEALKEGQDNPVKVICTAEDGSKKEYTVIAKRASANGESANSIASSEIISTASSSGTSSGSTPSNGIPVWAVVLIALVCAAAGFAAGFYIANNRMIINRNK